MLIELLRILTLPSANRKLQPPPWLLVALMNCELVTKFVALPLQMPHGYCDKELGGTIVLNCVAPTPPKIQWLPRLVPSTDTSGGDWLYFRARALHACRA